MLRARYDDPSLYSMARTFVRAVPHVTMSHVVLVIHLLLFNGIFKNAGQYRSSSDAWEGAVVFGKEVARRGGPEFTGSSPSNIKGNVDEAGAMLTLETQRLIDAEKNHRILLSAAMRFYQKFIKTHPFYDGNGRIGRLLTNAFLENWCLGIDWNRLEHGKTNRPMSSQFITLLNRCHKTDMSIDRNPFEDSFSRLVDHVMQHVIVIPSQETD